MMSSTSIREVAVLLSIVICNYNYARFLNEAIESAVRQTYPNTQVIVVDDGSTDGSAEIIARWQDDITAVFQPNSGQIAAYNRGCSEATGDVIVFVDSDDSLDREAGAEIIRAFEAPRVVKAHFRLRLVDAAGKRLGSTIPERLSDGDVSERLRRGVAYHSSPGSGNAYRREALLRLMPLPASEEDLHGADFFALHGIALLGDVRSAGDEPLGNYRVHVPGMTEQLVFGNARLREPKMVRQRYARLRRWLGERLGAGYELPEEFIDFSLNKQVFVDLLFNARRYTEGTCDGYRYLSSTLARSIWARATPVSERIALLGWASALLVLPRHLGRPLARYVCNPASRHSASFSLN